MNRQLFLKWLLLQAAAVSVLIGLGAAYGSRLGGSSLVAVPLILTVLAGASSYAGYFIWRWPYLAPADDRRNTLEWLSFSSWLCQMIGIMATVFGAWELLGGAGSAAELGERIQGGLGVALMGTFVGVFSSIVLELERRLIES